MLLVLQSVSSSLSEKSCSNVRCSTWTWVEFMDPYERDFKTYFSSVLAFLHGSQLDWFFVNLITCREDFSLPCSSLLLYILSNENYCFQN